MAVAEEYQAALTAASLLEEKLNADPGYGNRHGWRQKAGKDFEVNLEATYIVRMYAEFEAALRDYWKTHKGKDTHPKMVQLLNEAIPDQHFPQDCIDNADDVREYRNFLVHDIEEDLPTDMVPFTVQETKRYLCAYIACLDPKWK
ncbi:MAG TPA: hypothetical protein VH682_32975 [Gemmataceae bacterium]